MALPASGDISISDLNTEYSDTAPSSLTDFLSAGTGAPTSVPISLSDFYGLSAGAGGGVTLPLTWSTEIVQPSADPDFIRTGNMGQLIWNSDDSLWIGVGTNNQDEFIRSSDPPNATSWTFDNEHAGANLGLTQLVMTTSGATTIAAGGSIVNYVFTSTNGTSWSQRTTTSKGHIRSGVFGEGKIVFVGAVNSDTNRANIFYSTNSGSSWSNATTTNLPTGISLNGVAHNGTSFIAVGSSTGPSSEPLIAASTSGTSWTDETSGQPSSTNGGFLNSVAYGNSTWVAFGGDSSGDPMIVTSTGSGTGSWTKRTVASGINTVGRYITFGGGYFVATTLTQIMTSSDGINWTNETANIPIQVDGIDRVDYSESLGKFIISGKLSATEAYAYLLD